VSPSEYIANFFLVIIGFAVSEILRGSAKLIRERRMIKFYWPYFLIIPAVLETLMLVFLWLFKEVSSRADSAWTILDMGMLTLIVVPYAFMSYLIFPSRIKEGFDIKQFYFDNARTIITIMMAQIVIVTALMLTRGLLAEAAYQLLTLSLSGLVLWKFEKLHLIWLISMIVLINVFIFFIGAVSIGG